MRVTGGGGGGWTGKRKGSWEGRGSFAGICVVLLLKEIRSKCDQVLELRTAGRYTCPFVRNISVYVTQFVS